MLPKRTKRVKYSLSFPNAWTGRTPSVVGSRMSVICGFRQLTGAKAWRRSLSMALGFAMVAGLNRGKVAHRDGLDACFRIVSHLSGSANDRLDGFFEETFILERQLLVYAFRFPGAHTALR